MAKACERNLQNTWRCGGRLQLPSAMELRALLVRVPGQGGPGVPAPALNLSA